MDELTCELATRCAECRHHRERTGCTLLFRLNDALRAEAARPRELPLFSIVYREPAHAAGARAGPAEA